MGRKLLQIRWPGKASPERWRPETQEGGHREEGGREHQGSWLGRRESAMQPEGARMWRQVHAGQGGRRTVSREGVGGTKRGRVVSRSGWPWEVHRVYSECNGKPSVCFKQEGHGVTWILKAASLSFMCMDPYHPLWREGLTGELHVCPNWVPLCSFKLLYSACQPISQLPPPAPHHLNVGAAFAPWLYPGQEMWLNGGNSRPLRHTTWGIKSIKIWLKNFKSRAFRSHDLQKQTVHLPM